jgi:hypothetical protein
MSEPNLSAASAAKAGAAQGASEAAPGVSDLHKAQIRVIALQRNINALALHHRDMQQELARAEAEFAALRAKVEQTTGLVYNEQTLALESKREPKGQ